ncbi:hypothetical protein [Streptomyces sp. NPDC017958]|uniref:hypothetical protein n=2 Tax=unclassified Streptomyces TaxID=2593676 RepID=UPI0037BCA3EA
MTVRVGMNGFRRTCLRAALDPLIQSVRACSIPSGLHATFPRVLLSRPSAAATAPACR